MKDHQPGPGGRSPMGILAARAAALVLMLVVLGSARELERWGLLPLALACLMAAVAATTALLLIRR